MVRAPPPRRASGSRENSVPSGRGPPPATVRSSAIGQEDAGGIAPARRFEDASGMKSSGRDRESSRSGLVATLLLSSLALAGVLTWQAQASMRYHRGAAEKVLRDYAMLAADEFARRTVNEIGFYGFYPLVTAVRQEAAHGRLVPPAEIQASRDETLQPAADLLRSTFRYDVRSGRL